MIKGEIYARCNPAYTSAADIIDDVIINLNRSMRTGMMIGFRFGSVQASRCTEPEPGSGLLHDSPEIPLLSTILLHRT